MNNLNLEHWWKACFAGGIALSVAAAAIGQNGLILVGIGFACFGVGEWFNRPVQQGIHVGNGMRGVVTSYPWQPKPFGLAVDGVGIVLFFIGVYRLIFI
jgi:hypothetical protein